MTRRPTAELARDQVTATEILQRERVLDVFGHVALRDPASPDVFWLPRAVAPARLVASDLLPFGLDGGPLEEVDEALYAERYIHAAVFRARPDLTASCHHHAPSLMPFCTGAARLGALSQTGAWMGAEVPLWESRERFGDTGMLIADPDQAEDLAAALGEGGLVLLRGHGALVAGRSVQEMTFRAVYSCREADTLTAAAALGRAIPLSPGEIARAGVPSPRAVSRAWSHWTACPDRTTGKEG